MNPRKRTLRVQLDKTPEQLAIVRAMGSNNKTESMAALEAVAAVMTRPILQAIEQAPVVSNLYQTLTYDSGTTSTIPLDDYFDIRNRNYFQSWSPSQPGGTATNFVQGTTELYVQTGPKASAISFNKNYLAAGKIDHLAAGLTRLAQEILLLQQNDAAFTLFNSLAGSRIDGNGANNATNNLQGLRTATANVFQLDDLNNLQIGYDFTTASWVGGTPVNDQREITDLLGSPVWMGQMRSIAYQPQNTRQVVATQGASALGAPESVREQIFRGGDIPTLFNIVLHKVYEMGVGKAYNDIFDTAIGSVALPGYGQGFGGGTTSAFDGSTEEVIVGLNVDMFDLARLRMTDMNGEFTLVADDTFTQRSKKIGFQGELTEGYVSVEGRAKFYCVM